MSRVNIRIPIGTLSASVPYISAPNADNTSSPLILGSIPSGAKYMDVCIRYLTNVWESIGHTTIYPQLEVMDKKCIWLGDTNSFVTGGMVSCWGRKGNNVWASIPANSIIFRVINGILSVSPCHPSVSSLSRYMTDGIYITSGGNGATISATFYGF